MAEPDLLTMLAIEEDPEAVERVHCTLPSMTYVCGGCILDPVPGRSILGTDRWEEVTCPGCLAPGREAVAEACVRAQRNQADVVT